jgi:class 3 adenylate cyclase
MVLLATGSQGEPRGAMARIADDDHPTVKLSKGDTVIFSSRPIPGNEREICGIINKLVRQFDAAAESSGVERVRNTHNGYLASCGLTVPRLDNVHRTVGFAREMQQIINRFNTETGSHIKLRAGIDTGAVTSGLVGRAGLVYDLWGGAVHLASRMRRGVTEPGIYVSDDVYQATRDTLRYTSAGTITDGDSEKPTWRLSEDGT